MIAIFKIAQNYYFFSNDSFFFSTHKKYVFLQKIFWFR